MKFLLDESADLPLVAFLQGRGHDVTSVVQNYPRSIADTAVLAIAVREDRVLITNDKDFGELVFHRHLRHAGIILFRLENEPIPIKQQWLVRILTDYADQLRHFIVVTDQGTRLREARSPA